MTVFEPEELCLLGAVFDVIRERQNLTEESSAFVARKLMNRAIALKIASELVDRRVTATRSPSLQDSDAAFCAARVTTMT